MHFGCSVSRRAVTLILVFLLVFNQTLAATVVLPEVAYRVSTFAANDWPELKPWAGLAFSQSGQGGNVLIGQGKQRPAPKTQETQADRDRRIAKVNIYPGDVSVQVGETVQFTAIARDSSGLAIPGASFTWTGNDQGRNRSLSISQKGEFIARVAGVYQIRAESGVHQDQVKVTVTGDDLHGREVRPQRIIDVSSRDLPKISSLNKTPAGKTPSSKAPRLPVNQVPAGFSSRVGSSFMPVRAETTPKIPAKPITKATALLPDPNEWNETNIQLADDPGRERAPVVPNRVSSAGAGSGNFSFSAPLVSMAGRGLNLSLALNYNSRLWNRIGSEMVFNIDKDWPTPGFSLGFGKIVGTGDAGGYMIVEADGLHRSQQGQTATYSTKQEYNARTLDGSFIDYFVEGDPLTAGGAPRTATAKHPNGTVVQYGAKGQDSIYPTRITDASGNYITIAYRNNAGPQIDRITDTVGREVVFHYDSSNRLTAITAPGPGGNSIFEVARFHYKTLVLSPGFPGLTVRVLNNNYNIEVLDAIYYPSTGSGYWFGDADSYSSYGMLAKIVEQRGMTFSSSSLNFQGTVAPGSMSRQTVYNLPLQPASLSDTPLYTTRTESWAAMDSAPAVTTYSTQVNANPRTYTVTTPDGVKNVQTSFNNYGYYNDGVPSQQTVYPTASASLPTRTSTTTWSDSQHTVVWYGYVTVTLTIPRPTRIESTENSLPTKVTEFGYAGGLFNQVTSVREYDYTGALARTTTTEYENSAAYVNRHVFNLVKAQEVLAANGMRASRTEYRYDEYPLQQTAGVVRHDNTYNPYAPDSQYCEWVSDPNDPDCSNPYCDPGSYGCDGYCGLIYQCQPVPVFDPTTLKRGDVTSIVRYTDAANLSGAITETRKYDMAGNLISITDAACCQQTSIQYTLATQFAYPVSQTRGAISDTIKQIKTTAVWDLWTGLVQETRDGDNNLTTITYNATTLRPETIFLPTGAYTYSLYQDSSLAAYERAYGSDGLFVGGSDSYLSGLGQTRAQVNYSAETAADVAAGNYQTETVNIEYDSTGRAVRQSRPYRVGETLVWSLIRYDWAGRPDRITAPDGSVSQNFYDERIYPGGATQQHGMTVRSVDAWGRERWARTDALGRMVEVLEPNPNGGGTVTESGALRTEYLYDALNQITKITQGVQTRWFQHDSLGRLTYQKLAEQEGTIIEAGGAWSSKFEYDTRSNLIRQTDARGVVTNLNYNSDPLNRLQSVSYTVPAAMAATIPSAATVSYQYVTSGDITRVQTITDGMGSEVYGYDGYGRVTQVIRNLNGRSPLVTNYDYDSFSRLKQTTYPARYGQTGSPRTVIAESYRVGGTMKDLKVDSANVASQFQYNAANQVKTMTLGNGAVEWFGYDAQTGLLTGQTLTGAGQSLLNLTYGYNGAGAYAGVKTGQITAITDNLAGNNGDRNRAFNYDKLGRLAGVNGTRSGAAWSQSYVYDRYGNREQVIASGSLIAQLEMPELPELKFHEPQQPTIKDQVAEVRSPAFTRNGSEARSLAFTRNGSEARSLAFTRNGSESRSLAFTRNGSESRSLAFTRNGSEARSLALTRNGSEARSPAFTRNSSEARSTAFTRNGLDGRNLPLKSSTTNMVTDANIGGPRSASSPQINKLPVCNAGGPYTGSVGATISFNGSASYDPDGSIVSYIWNFGDNSAGTGSILGHAYSAAGTYTVSLTVRDNRSASRICSTTATVTGGSTNQSPIARPGGPYAGTVGTAISFNGSTSSDPDGTITAYTWDFGDGTTATGAAPSKSYSSTGTYTVTLTVTDNQGATHSATTTATISSVGNQSPVARPGGPYSGTVGAAIAFNGSTSSGSITAYNWNFGDGTTATGAAPSKSYSAAGTFTVTLTVTDNQGATNSATTTATISAGTTANYEGYFDGADCNTIWGWAADRNRLNTSINVDIYDGTTLILSNVPANQSRPDVGTYLGDNGLHGFTIAIPASLKNGQPHSLTVKYGGTSQALGSSPRNITCATNQSPIARPGGPYSGTVGTSISFNGSTSSDSDGTIASYSWNFGDGATATGATPSKSYSATGTFTVTLTVTDNQGATNSATTTATISSPPSPGGALTDGAPSLSYDPISNRISTSGYQYDSAGNLTRGQAESGVWQRYQYDAANRLVTVMNDSSVVIVTNSYGADNGRLKSIENGVTRWYGWDGGQCIVEYSDNGTNLVWARSYVYLGGRLLLTDEPTGRQYHHADRLGTRIVTNASGAKVSEQATLPFETALGSPETSGTPSNRRFTSYNRSSATKLDYAINRSYASWQGRFTQVDPLGMGAVSVCNPQSLNLYGYVQNDPVNFVDPSGLNKHKCMEVTFTCVDDGLGGKDCGYDYYWKDCDDGGGGGSEEIGGGGGSNGQPANNGIVSKLKGLIPSVCGGGGFGYAGVGGHVGAAHAEALALVQYDSREGGSHGGLVGAGAGDYTLGIEAMRTWKDWQEHRSPIGLGGKEVPGATRVFGKKVNTQSRDIGGLAQYENGQLTAVFARMRRPKTLKTLDEIANPSSYSDENRCSLGIYAGVTLSSKRTFGGGLYFTLSWKGCHE